MMPEDLKSMTSWYDMEAWIMWDDFKSIWTPEQYTQYDSLSCQS